MMKNVNLKATLFSKVFDAFETLQREKRIFPNEDHELSRRTFCALWDVVEAAGLDDEYYSWRTMNHGEIL